MDNRLPDRPLPTAPATHAAPPSLIPPNEPWGEHPGEDVSLTEPVETSYEHISWRITGWDPAAPFRGELQFTGSTGQLLLSLPVDPSTMQSLNEITDAVLDAQHEAFGLSLGDADETEDSASTTDPRRRLRLPGKDIGEERTVVNKELFGVPFRMTVRPKALRMLGMITGGILLVAFVANLLN